MEKRKDTINTLKLCRFCLAQDATLTSLYERDPASENAVPLSLKILSCVSIDVYPSDKMPSYICKKCKFFMELSYEYKQICRKADEKILQFVQTGSSLTSVSWPVQLLKAFNNGVRPVKEVGIVKTVEGEATVHVLAEGSDMSEDEEGNIYDVKIGDESGEGTKNTRVKVVTDQKKTKPQQRKDIDDSERSEDNLVPIREGCWPCDLCDCTYPLKQLLHLHKQQKHRKRTHECDECDAKFFSVYDLMTHKQRHGQEMSFKCGACDKQFKRHIRLKRHEKFSHADLPQQKCIQCPASFLSLEQLEEHQKRHVDNAVRQFVCPLCDKRFHEKSILQKHQENVHNRIPEFFCEYCPEQFTTISKLTRHVREHASKRAYPCKYCEKSFLKSHHYTRHLRLKHREIIRSARGPFGSNDRYKCDQCDDTFTTQDELIYHSAIHATQNLTCPLCQEKFENVDDVTTHIKSHANGMEFMCDMCELVFTNKQKLDKHMADAHQEEMDNYDDENESEEMEGDDEDDDNSINLKEEDGEMVVEIKKPDEFMLPNLQDETDDKMDNTNSEESESEQTYTELSTVDTLAVVKKDVVKPNVTEKTPATGGKSTTMTQAQLQANILKKAEEAKKKAALQKSELMAVKKVNSKPESGTSDKSLRLLEKELQDLKRTNVRSEAVKTPVKPVELARNRRPQVHTSTPKPKPISEEKKTPVASKLAVAEKKAPKTVTKENKEPKEAKTNNGTKDEKEKENKEKETPKSAVKNGNANTSDKSIAEDGIRRSTRPSRIKDYAKMIRDGSQDSNEENTSDADDEFKESEKSVERPKPRRSSIKAVQKTSVAADNAAPSTPATPVVPRKRGRPRKEPPVPPKIKKETVGEEETKQEEVKTKEDGDGSVPNETSNPVEENNTKTQQENPAVVPSEQKTPPSEQKTNLLVSPTGQTLKKVPIKALPPGIKPLPLPTIARPLGNADVCEMQIGKKMVKVQKIVMTKAEVEAMAKKGLVEIKDGTMMLKQGIKLPTADSASVIKNSLVSEEPAKQSKWIWSGI